MTAWRARLTLLLTLFVVLGTFAAPGLAPQPLRATALAAPAEAANLTIVKQGYDLLLDRHVQVLDPAALLNAAYTGVAAGLRAAGVPVANAGPLQLGPNRDAAWAAFQQKMDALLQDSPPPPGFDVTGTALAAMTRWIDEGHTGYLNQQQYKDFQAYMRGDLRYGGIGVRIRQPGFTVAEVFENSPAARAGLASGDVLVAVDGEPTAGKTSEEVSRLVRGPEGTSVRLDVQRPDVPDKLTFTIMREQIKVDYISTSMIQGDIGYIRLRGFPEPSVAFRFEQFLDSLPSQRARGLVIDLRGNSGGRVDVGTRLLNRFITSGPLYSEADRSGNRRVQEAFGRGWANPIPVAILIDDGSASMAEIFASAMHEHGLARLIGQKTSGNVAASVVFPLDDGSGLQMAVREIYSGNGVRIDRVGVDPDDVVVPTQAQLESGRDVQLETAIVYIWAQTDRAAQAAIDAGP